jgi:hypothetical protein
VYLVFPETRGPTLEEISRIFDGDSAVAHIDMHIIEKEIEAERFEDIHHVKNFSRIEQTRL